MGLPLEGIRILAVTQYGAGPWAMLQLAELGAEIIKIENPLTNGDVARRVPPYLVEGVNDSIYYQSFNRNSRSITLNLQKAGSREVLERLTKVSHGVFSNLRGDLPTRMRLRYKDLKSVNPRIVTCHLTGYGLDNSRSARPSYDHLIQGETGFMELTGEPGGLPQRCGVSVVDFAGSYNAAFALTTGLLKAQMTGEGCDLDVSLHDTAISMMNYLAAWHLSRRQELRRQPDSSHPAQVPIGLFQTNDGALMIMCAKEEFYQSLCEKLGRPEWKDDGRFKRFADRLANREVLVPMLKQELRRRSTAEWLDLFGNEVPCAPVRTPAAALADPFLQERGMLVEMEHPELGTVRGVAAAVRTDAGRAKARPGATMGADTEDVLRALGGYSTKEIGTLRWDGVV